MPYFDGCPFEDYVYKVDVEEELREDKLDLMGQLELVYKGEDIFDFECYMWEAFLEVQIAIDSQLSEEFPTERRYP